MAPQTDEGPLEQRCCIGTLVEAYLRSRGITVRVPPTIRSVHAKHSRTGLILPCMVAAIFYRLRITRYYSRRRQEELLSKARAALQTSTSIEPAPVAMERVAVPDPTRRS